MTRERTSTRSIAYLKRLVTLQHNMGRLELGLTVQHNASGLLAGDLVLPVAVVRAVPVYAGIPDHHAGQPHSATPAHKNHEAHTSPRIHSVWAVLQEDCCWWNRSCGCRRSTAQDRALQIRCRGGTCPWSSCLGRRAPCARPFNTECGNFLHFLSKQVFHTCRCR